MAEQDKKETPRKRIMQGVFTPEQRKIANEFFEYKRTHSDVPEEELTPLQRRMQSGGA